MAIALSGNIDYNGVQPNFARDLYKDIASMKSVARTKMPKMFIGSCIETGKVYLYDKNNTEDPTLGYWRELPATASVSEEAGNKIVKKDDGIFVGETTADDITVSGATLTAKISTIESSVATATSTATEAKTNAATAQTTAEAAQTAADEAKAAAEAAKTKIEILTQQEYDALSSKDAETLYLIGE